MCACGCSPMGIKKAQETEVANVSLQSEVVDLQAKLSQVSAELSKLSEDLEASNAKVKSLEQLTGEQRQGGVPASLVKACGAAAETRHEVQPLRVVQHELLQFKDIEVLNECTVGIILCELFAEGRPNWHVSLLRNLSLGQSVFSPLCERLRACVSRRTLCSSAARRAAASRSRIW